MLLNFTHWKVWVGRLGVGHRDNRHRHADPHGEGYRDAQEHEEYLHVSRAQLLRGWVSREIVVQQQRAALARRRHAENSILTVVYCTLFSLSRYYRRRSDNRTSFARFFSHLSLKNNCTNIKQSCSSDQLLVLYFFCIIVHKSNMFCFSIKDSRSCNVLHQEIKRPKLERSCKSFAQYYSHHVYRRADILSVMDMRILRKCSFSLSLCITNGTKVLAIKHETTVSNNNFFIQCAY